MPLEPLPDDYPCFLNDLKESIRAARTKAVLAVNRELIELYWDLGRQVVECQKQGGWGTRVIERLSRDIRTEFPGIKGFSRQNIQCMRSFSGPGLRGPQYAGRLLAYWGRRHVLLRRENRSMVGALRRCRGACTSAKPRNKSVADYYVWRYNLQPE